MDCQLSINRGKEASCLVFIVRTVCGPVVLKCILTCEIPRFPVLKNYPPAIDI